jgi:hypothetical protein
MKFYGLELKGKFWIQRQPDITDIPWTAEDEGRLVYNEADNILYYGSNTEWVKSTQARYTFNEGQRIIFAASPLPDDWNIPNNIADMCPMITNTGSQTGDTGGNWNLTYDSDSLPITIVEYAGSHNHFTPDQMTGDSDSDRRGTSEIFARVAVGHWHDIQEGWAGDDYGDGHKHNISFDGNHRHTFDGTWRFPHVLFTIGEYTP